jgi:Tol biopolymer transport system component
MIRRGLIALICCGVVVSGATARAAPTHDFKIATHPYAFGQAPDWLGKDHVVFNEAATGKNQVYVSRVDGRDRRCLTCTLDAGPNQVPVARPQGDWILFHSWHGKSLTIGGPGFGGLGSEMYVVRPDGSGITRLAPRTEGNDDYHAYFSPDGKRVVYTHLNWNFVTESGRGNWDIRVADFVVDGKGTPSLRNTRVVRPENGHFYETQHWAPDGSGFLFTESVDTAVNLELFFCRLTASGCDVARLTRDPAWDEQAIFTPDMKRVIFMSTRDHPGAFTSWTQTATLLGIPAGVDNVVTLPVFEIGFLQPLLEQSNDLYELDLRSKRVRRLTDDGDAGWIIPEFAWDPTGKRLLWTELKYRDELRVAAPLDAAREAREALALLGGPPPSGAGSDGASRDSANANLVRRTRIARYVRKRSCRRIGAGSKCQTRR